MNREKRLRIYLIAAVVIILVPVFLFSYLEMMIKELTYNPEKHFCIERKSFICVEEGCFSCYSVFTQDFPQCCIKWVERKHSERYASCIEDIFFIHQNTVANISDINKLFNYCLRWDKEEFLEKIRHISEKWGVENESSL